MDKYEYKQLSERMIELMQNEEYGEAKEIADSIDWRRVRNAMMLANVSDIYEKTGEYQKTYYEIPDLTGTAGSVRAAD